MKRILMSLVALITSLSLTAISPEDKWVEQDAGFATVNHPDELHLYRAHKPQLIRLPAAESTMRPYKQQATLYEADEKQGRYVVMIFRYEAADEKHPDINDVKRKCDTTINTLTSGKSRIKWLNFSKDELRGFTTFDDPYIENGVKGVEPKNMLCRIIRKGNTIYYIEARFPTKNTQHTTELRNQIMNGISGSLKPKYAE